MKLAAEFKMVLTAYEAIALRKLLGEQCPEQNVTELGMTLGQVQATSAIFNGLNNLLKTGSLQEEEKGDEEAES